MIQKAENIPNNGWDKLSQKQVLFASLAHAVNIYQYLEIERCNSDRKSLSCRSEVMGEFTEVVQEYYDNWMVEWLEALYEAIRYRRKWDIRKAAMYVLCAWEMDWELKKYVEENINMIESEIKKYNFKKRTYQ